MRTLVELEAYFAATSLQVAGVEHFVFGDNDEFVGVERNSSIRYPCVWMETPMSMVEEESEDVWIVRLLVLKKARPKQTRDVLAAHNLTQIIAKRLLKRIEHDAEESNLWSLGKAKHKINPIYVGSDGNVGWYFELKIEVEEECHADADLGIGTAVLPSTGGLILIHPATAQRFAVTVDTDGAIITTPINDTRGTTSILLNDGSTLIINNADGTVAST